MAEFAAVRGEVQGWVWIGGGYRGVHWHHLGYVEVGCKVQAGISMLAFHVGGWVDAGHSVSKGICGHKDGMEAGML